ncbi:hypothetical protein [Sedimentitalea todarodis]|uniref:Wadjet protein JetD C-terminal domain-containing protein n=1 Tax=Sedimentitalea todarodis TaxID=1631240 RepID=A0ABU3VI25_9RHOB|nr:hypothetical protein [Sedimentitalea todarodis]MDU9005758.1 hypothetical protein [Sedimentitalea todarodis]
MTCTTRVRGFAPWNPQRKSLILVAQVQEVLDEYRQHLPLTIRQVFYRLVGSQGYGKTESAYSRLCETMNRARRAGLIDFDAIRDDGVSRHDPHCWTGVEQVLLTVRGMADSYRLDRQDGQPVRLFVKCEAGGMAPMLARSVDEYGVSVISSGGFDSLSAKYQFAMELAEYGKTEILHIGDCDPSGVHLFKALAEDIQAMCIGLDAGGVPTFTRLAVTPVQIEAMNLPTAPAKKTDRRAFEGETVQAEAIPPDVLIDIVRQAVIDRQDVITRQEVLDQEERDREELRAFFDGEAGQ